MIRFPSLNRIDDGTVGRHQHAADGVDARDVDPFLANQSLLEKRGDGRPRRSHGHPGPIGENGRSQTVGSVLDGLRIDDRIGHELPRLKPEVAHEPMYREGGTVSRRLCLENLGHYAAFLSSREREARSSSAPLSRTRHSPASSEDLISFKSDCRP